MSPRLRAGAAALALLVAAAPLALAQTPFWQPQSQQPQQQPPPSSSPAPPTRTAPAQAQAPPASTPAAPKAPSPVIARIEGKALTQADFDRVAVPYFARMRAQFGAGFEGDIVKIANHNVLDELVRRELLRIEATRQKIQPAQADIDSVLSRDPYFWTTGKFDAQKFEQYKTSPQSNYGTMLPELRELAAMDVLDRKLRKDMTPTSAAVREEWAKRNDQLHFHSFAILQRDITLDPESSEKEWKAYYDKHHDEFVRRTRVRFRYVKLALPAATDSTRMAEEQKATATAKALLDSIQKKQIPDTSERLMDSGMIEALGANIPAVGFSPELQEQIGKADSVASVRAIGPLTVGDAVVAGVLTDREPKHLPPFGEVVADVRRQADIEKRRTQADDDRHALYRDHPEKFRSTRMKVTRLVLADDAIQTRQPNPAEYATWWQANWRRVLNVRDTTHLTAPPLTDSIKTAIKRNVQRDLRPAYVDQVTAKLAESFKTSKDYRAVAKAAGAVAETLTLVQGVTNDSLFLPPMLDTYYRDAMAKTGVVQGPAPVGQRYVVWRVESADTAFVPPYDNVRLKVDNAFREQERQKDEADGRAWFEPRKSKYKTQTQYGIDLVRVRIAPADSVKVTDAELKAAYDKGKDRFRQEEQVKARHLLILTQANASAADKAKARARADSLLKAAKGGADFTELCRTFSQEPGAASSAGDLGWFGRGRMVKEFETAAFALKPGEMSGVVQTQFGYHIIRVEDHKAAGIRTYEEVKPELRMQIGQARADTAARRTAVALRRKLALGGDAATLSRPHGGIVHSVPFAANDVVPGVGFLQGLSTDLPKLAAGKWSPNTYRTGADYIVVRLREKQPPHPATFDEVQAQVIDDMKTERKKDLLEKKVAAIRSALASGTSPDSVAAPYGGFRESSPVTANAAFVPTLGYGPHIVPKILKLKPGEVSDSLSTPLGVMWVRFDKRQAADAAMFKTQKDQLQQEMVFNAMNDWLEKQKKSVKIEVLRADLREPKPGPYKTVTLGGGG